MKVPCKACGGTGKLDHECEQHDVDLVEEIYRDGFGFASESLGIYRCRICSQLWMIRFQSDPGTGRDDIWLRPGQSARGYEFTYEKAKNVQAALIKEPQKCKH